ncbi:MAG TPA: hypothetical protein VH640_18280 [Bryobacteraceae bacterium]|jgi:uncharacterized protein (TIGR03437 family)
MNKLKLIAWLLPFLAGFQAAAQNWDTSGNKLLNGTYYFRQVIWAVTDQSGDVGEAVSVFGTLSFNGNGQYTVSSVQVNDSGANGICTVTQSSNSCQYPTSGTYSIAANGYGFLDSLITSDEVYGLVSNGIFIASSTENISCQNGNNPCYNDVFIAVPVGSTPLTNSSFQGTYTMFDLDLTLNLEASNSGGQGILYSRGSTFQMTPNGSGNIPGFTASGYIAGNGTTKTTQSVASTSYSFQNGAAVWTLSSNDISSGNANTALIAGQKYLYFSPDGNFVVGGSPNVWDMIVGVRTNSSNSNNFSGLYYQAGALVDDSTLSGSSPYADLQSYYGAYCTGSCIGSPTEVVGHQRLDDALFGNGFASDYTYLDTLALSNGQYSDSFNQYVFTDNGAIGIGSPTIFTSGAQLGFAVLVQAPTFTPSGVYIYPTGVLNSGSSAPFTAQFAPGELISIYGSNLASTTATDLTLPTTLGGTQVMVNGTAAPIAYVSKTQINAVIPIGINTSIASLQVVNGSGSSNIVTNFVGETQPGVFNSLTQAALQHADYSMVTSSHPIVPGETILVYLTGLGTLSGQNATQSFAAYFEDPTNGTLTANIAFAGSQSAAGGGYQMNIQVPTNVTSGNEYLDIAGPDSYNSEIVVPIGSAGSTASLRKQNRVAHPSNKLRTRPRFQRDSRSAASHLQFRHN